ncbi:autorepressor SdpR family transcription factor [uncultured Pseudoflavonifractor sp.]|uniref:autorepressor SdpR family transcription factor n=1 Tax=uncultured Pseudoflavonifractor sp. TaxID=1221379 RepID=UPI0034234B38
MEGPGIFKALSDPVRWEILLLLRGGELPAGEIAARLSMTAAAVSYHLACMKRAGLIRERREKNYIYYEMNATVLEEAALWLSQLCAGAGEARHEARKTVGDAVLHSDGAAGGGDVGGPAGAAGGNSRPL